MSKKLLFVFATTFLLFFFLPGLPLLLLSLARELWYIIYETWAVIVATSIVFALALSVRDRSRRRRAGRRTRRQTIQGPNCHFIVLRREFVLETEGDQASAVLCDLMLCVQHGHVFHQPVKRRRHPPGPDLDPERVEPHPVSLELH